MSIFRRKQSEHFWLGVMTDNDVHRLAIFNGERARGVQHTPEYQAEMAKLQTAYDEARMHRNI